jgi:hypothetical protein
LIYICIPAHNEQQTIGVVLWKLRQVLTEFPRDYQLLVADDASTDRTTEVLEPYTRVLPLTVISSRQRQGYAASLEMLLREAIRRSEYPKRDVIVTLQADFSEEPDDIVGLVKRMEAGADVAVGIKVGSSAESRVRRLARSLASFFTRRQAWPEGVVTPFDGYRAYRLHAVKRAMEERDGQRLLHYDGWACQAELLRAVLPHARRVEALNVEDRADRLQRPRRERPLQSAWQVRAMAAGHEPAGLATVEELDSVAAGGRSRERALLNGTTLRQASGTGSRSATRERRGGDGRARPAGRSGDGREQRESKGRRDAPRSEAGAAETRERPRPERPRRDRTRPAETAAEAPARRDRTRPAETAADAPARSRSQDEPAADAPARSRSQDEPAELRRQRAPDEVTEETAAGTEVAAEALGSPGAEAEDAGPKKRRRRRRSRGRSAGDAAASETTLRDDGAGDDGAGDDRGDDDDRGDGDNAPGSREPGTEGEAGTDAASGAPMRKRRRRGGRGRRRSRPAADGDADGTAADGTDGAEVTGADRADAGDVSVEAGRPANAPQSESESRRPENGAAQGTAGEDRTD